MDAHSNHEDESPSRSADGSTSSSRGEDTAAATPPENSPGDGDAVNQPHENSKQQDDDENEVVAGDDNDAGEDVGFGPPPAFPSSNKALGKRKHTVLEVSSAPATNAKLQDDSSEDDAAKSSGTGNTSSSNRNKQSQMIHRMKTTETTEEETTNDDTLGNITMNKSGDEYYDAMLLASLSDLGELSPVKAGSLTARSPTDETQDDIGSPKSTTTAQTPSVAPTPTQSNVNPNIMINRPYALVPKSGPLYTTPNSRQRIATSSTVGVSNNPQHSPDRRDPKAITPRSAEGRGSLPEGMMYGGRSGPPPHHYQYQGYHHHPGYPPPHHSQHYPPPHASAAGPPPPHHGHPPPPSEAYPPYHHPHGYYGSPTYPPPHGYHHGGAPSYAPPPPPPPPAPSAGPYRPRQQALPPPPGANPEIPEPIISRTRSQIVPEEGSGEATGGTDKGSSKSISSSSATRGMPPAPPPGHYTLLESSSYISVDDSSPPRKSMSATNRGGSGASDVAGQAAKEYSTLPSAFTPPRGGARTKSYHFDPYHQASAYPPPPDYYGGPPPYAPPPPVYDPYAPYDYSTVVQPNVNSGDVVRASVSDEPVEPNYRGGVPPPPPMAKGSSGGSNNNNHHQHQQFRKGGRSIHSEPVILRKKFSWRNYPELEEFLIANRSEYLRHSALNYTAEQKHFNNRLTEGLLEVAARMNYVFDESCFNFVAVRDRIRCYYKSFVQSSKKRGIVVGFPPNQGEEEMMENQHHEGTINDYHYGVSG